MPLSLEFAAAARHPEADGTETARECPKSQSLAEQRCRGVNRLDTHKCPGRQLIELVADSYHCRLSDSFSGIDETSMRRESCL